MKKSKYAFITMINFNVYAIYNSLILQPIYFSFWKMLIFKFNFFHYFSKDELDILIKNGIIIKNINKDNNALNTVKDTINGNIKNKISLMYIIPNNNCNLMCKYCFIGKLNNSNPIKMSIETMKNAIDKFADHLKQIDMQIGEVVFYGGEPLINFNLIKECIIYSKNKNYNLKFSIVSNATLINDEITDFIKQNNIGLGISIDGPKNITDKNRIFANDFTSVYDKVISKINLLKSKNVEFGLSITISPDFLKKQDEFLTWISNLNVKNISYNLLHFTTSTNFWKKYYKDATKFIIKSNNLLYPMGFDEDRIRRKYYSFYERDFKYSDCGARGGNQITIKPNGDMTICHGYWNTNENEIGNINTINSLSDIFKTSKYIDWNCNIPINNNKCQECNAIYICGGGCAMQAKTLFGDEKNIDKAFCIHSKKMLKYILTELYYEEK